MKKNNLLFFITGILMFLYSLATIGFAIILKYLIDSVSMGNQNQFFKLLLLTLCIVLLEFLFAFLSKFYALKYVRNNLEVMKNNFFSKFLHNDKERETDISMFSNNIDILANNYYMKKVLLILYISNFCLAIYAVFSLNWIICIVSFLTSIIALSVPQIFKKQAQKSTDKYTESSKKYLDFVSDSNLGIDEIRSYNNQDIFSEKHNAQNSDLEHSRFKNKLVIYFINILAENFSILTFLITIGLSGYMVMIGNITFGSMIAIIQLLNNMVFPLIQISSTVNEINSSKNLVKKYKINILKEELNYNNIESFKNNITISNLSFSYEKNTPLIENFNYKFEKNKKYAIVGESGSGKSTLAKIISGNVKNYSGNILIDDIDINKINLNSYRNVCKYINQQSYIFKDTIKNNILFYNKEEIDLNTIIEQLNLEDLTKEEGLDKLISDTQGVSSGQKQRIILSRALTRKFPILILDEPTANLDHKNTKEIIEQLLKINDITIILITHEHDENLLSLFDNIIYIN